MSNDISRSDVATFMQNAETFKYFKFFERLIAACLPPDTAVKTKTDILISGMIGIAICTNTLRDCPWNDAKLMTRHLLASLTS